MPVVLQKGSGSFRGGLRELLDAARPGLVIVVVPTKRKIRHLTRELLRTLPEGVAAPFPIHTLESFAHAVYRSGENALPSVTGPEQTILFDRAVQIAGSAFRYFSSRRRDGRLFPGTFERVTGVITHLKESGVYPELLEKEAIEAPLDDRSKLFDVAALYRAYDKELAGWGAEDSPGVFRHLGETLGPDVFNAVFRTAFPEAGWLLLAGFDEFTAPELVFLKRVTSVEGLTSAVVFDFQHGNAALFGHLEDNYARFREMGFHEIPEPPDAGRALFSGAARSRTSPVTWADGTLGQRLFLPGPPGQRLPSRGKVTVIRARNRTREIAAICRFIRSIVAQDPSRDLSTIAVAMVRPQRYTEIIRQQFRRYGIPANITDRYDLARSPLVSTLLGVLRIALHDFRRDDILRVGGSPCISFRDDGTPVDVAAIAEVSSRLRISGGLGVWRARIRERRQYLEEGQGTREHGREREGSQLDRVAADLAAIERVVSPFAGSMTPVAFAAAFETMIERLQVPARLVSRGVPVEREVVERDVRAWVRLVEIVRETAAVASAGSGGSRRHLRDLLDMLRLAVLRERYNVREESGRGVLVTAIDETRGLPVEIMFVAGLVDGEFPSVYQTEVFLSAPRQRMREQRHNWRNRYLFYQAVSNWSDRLFLSYPDSDGDVDLVRSPFVDAFLGVVDAKEADGETVAGETLWSPEDALAWLAPRAVRADDVPEGLRNRLSIVRTAAEVERSRTGLHDRPAFEGILAGALSGPSIDFLRKKRTAVFSVTQLETYQACPFRYLAEHLLRLRVPEEFREDLTAAEQGALLHETLRRFYTHRRDRNLPVLAGCSDETFREASDELRRMVEEALASQTIPDPFWEVERESLLGSGGDAGGVLRAFLETERARLIEAKPSFFEAGFGGGAAGGVDPLLSTAEPLEIGGVFLRGRIDRVDTGGGFFAVVDYKTGKVLPGRADLESGLSLQLPVYLAAAGLLLGERGGVPGAALYYQLHEPARVVAGLADRRFEGRAYLKREGSRRPAVEETEFRALITAGTDALARAADGIASARFPLAEPRLVNRVCRSCPYTTICRIQSLHQLTTTEPEET